MHPSDLLAVLQGSPAETFVVTAYMTVMSLLALFGMHRFTLLLLYYRNASEAAEAPAPPERLPKITAQLPIYNEPRVVEALIDSVCRLDYPRSLLQIQVLDDSTDETSAVAAAAVARWAARGVAVEHLRRENRVGYKAGALAAGLRRASGELIAVFDADFLPNPDFLRRMVGAFGDPKVGCAQARWTYRNREESLLTRLQAVLLDGHFVFEQGGRSRSGRFFNFNGTAGILRRAMIEDAGGWEHDTLTEDTDLSYRAQLRGWRFVYLPDVEVVSELPGDMRSFQKQQARWAKGLVQTLLKLGPRILSARIPLGVKYEALQHLGANLSYPLMAALAALLLPTSIARANDGVTWLLLLDVPIFAATFGSLFAFYLLSQRELFGAEGLRRVWLIPGVMAAGVALMISNAGAVWEALRGVRTPFERTLKTGGTAPNRDGGSARSGGRLSWANLAAGGYFLFCAGYSLDVGAWLLTPFLMVFCAGHFYAGAADLFPSRGAALEAADSTKPVGGQARSSAPAN